MRNHGGSRVSTYVYANDPILQAGVTSTLRMCAEVRLVAGCSVDSAEVAVVVADALDDAVYRNLRAIQRGGVPRTMLVLGSLDETTVVAAAEAGVSGMIRRTDATRDNLVAQIKRIAAGGGAVPPDLVGTLLEEVGYLQRRGGFPRRPAGAPLSEREIEVLRLVSEGFDTAAIADELCYSERTVKSVLHGVTTRLHLRNRTHAVAYAMREGLI
ncbi:helix-turn-helix transcriptional regulator [Williamsia soli]|uniref:helix-turn-helix transcriptional regulator n=1 Tax=Williamsia soli TaxID=364929 RepID=UPI001A9D7DBF|nr:response regulator transcription factor [Williamsia soli]